MIYKLKDTVDADLLHSQGKSGVLIVHDRPYTSTELANRPYEYDDAKIAEWFELIGEEPPAGDAAALRAWLLESPVLKAFPWIQTLVGSFPLQNFGVRELVQPILKDLIDSAIARGMDNPPALELLDDKLDALTVVNKLLRYDVLDKPTPSHFDSNAATEPEWSIAKAPADWCKIVGVSDSTLRRYRKNRKLVVKEISSKMWQIRLDTLAQFLAPSELGKYRAK